jgi:hypothetical protein
VDRAGKPGDSGLLELGHAMFFQQGLPVPPNPKSTIRHQAGLAGNGLIFFIIALFPLSSSK